jgi:hypothetical protein
VYVSQEFRSGAVSTTLESSGTAMVNAEGKFAVKDLAPGDYKLVLRDVTGSGNSTHVEEVGLTRISVNGTDLHDVAIVTSRGWSVSGKVVTDRGPIPDGLRNQFSIVGSPTMDEADLKVGGIDESGVVGEDGAFSLAGLFGRNRIRANLPVGWVLKSVLRDGRDITDEPIELRTGQQTSSFELVVTDRITSIAGHVTDDRDRPVADGHVIVFPRDADKWSDDARYIRAVRSDQQGQFEIRRLPAGDYLAVAIERLLEGEWNDPEFLDQIRAHAQRVQLADGDARTISLAVIDP